MPALLTAAVWTWGLVMVRNRSSSRLFGKFGCRSQGRSYMVTKRRLCWQSGLCQNHVESLQAKQVGKTPAPVVITPHQKGPSVSEGIIENHQIISKALRVVSMKYY